ncbi:peptidase [Pseudescherichia sp.]|uniref:peptidase n=1 Tax=Pseudescherichia sp. TaxID=2055881 RepID=UPI0039183809
MGNALFRKLFQSALMSEAPAPESSGGGGDAPAPAADPSTPAGNEPPAEDPAKPAADPEKPDGEKKQEQQKPEGAPEKYEFKAAEGQELDAAALEQFEPIARELNLTNEQAQKMVDLYGTQILPMVQKQQAEAWQKTTEQWAADVKADKEIGGDKLTANIGVAQRALETFGTPDLKEYLNSTGLGNHPDLIKFCVKVGQAMSEDKVLTGNEHGQRSAAQVLYG